MALNDCHLPLVPLSKGIAASRSCNSHFFLSSTSLDLHRYLECNALECPWQLSKRPPNSPNDCRRQHRSRNFQLLLWKAPRTTLCCRLLFPHRYCAYSHNDNRPNPPHFDNDLPIDLRGSQSRSRPFCINWKPELPTNVSGITSIPSNRCSTLPYTHAYD